MNLLWDMISISIIVFHVYPFLRFVETQKALYAWFGLGIILMDLSIKGIKSLLIFPHELFKRPKGATGCDALCMKGGSHGQPGFPSGHVAGSAFFFTTMWLMSSEATSRTIITIVGMVVTIIVAISRVAKKCHNSFQVIVGALYGFAFAIGWYHLGISINI